MIYTVGHSTRSLETFLALLAEHQIRLLVDVRRYPASRRYPHFVQEPLAAALEAVGIAYPHHRTSRRCGERRAPLAARYLPAGFHGFGVGYAARLVSTPPRVGPAALRGAGRAPAGRLRPRARARAPGPAHGSPQRARVLRARRGGNRAGATLPASLHRCVHRSGRVQTGPWPSGSHGG